MWNGVQSNKYCPLLLVPLLDSSKPDIRNSKRAENLKGNLDNIRIKTFSSE
jgi:hypothetical protein